MKLDGTLLEGREPGMYAFRVNEDGTYTEVAFHPNYFAPSGKYDIPTMRDMWMKLQEVQEQNNQLNRNIAMGVRLLMKVNVFSSPIRVTLLKVQELFDREVHRGTQAPPADHPEQRA